MVQNIVHKEVPQNVQREEIIDTMPQNTLTIEELKKGGGVLVNMSCTDILVPDSKDNLLVAIFNCR